MRILTVSTLYPNAAQPTHGVFVENRLRHLIARHGIGASVVAPVPYFPFKHPLFKSYAEFARAPKSEHRKGLQVQHPRYLVIPKLGAGLTPHTLYRAMLQGAEAARAQGGDFDLIDAHYFYPDGVAAARLAKTLNKPLLITARGTDINLIPQNPQARQQIVGAAATAQSVVAVCEALRQEMISLGIEEAKLHTLRNGVDLEHFSPGDRGKLRTQLGLTRPTLASVGHLIDRKGHHLVIEALAHLPELDLLIVGEGPRRGALQAQAAAQGVGDRVRFLGRIPHSDLGAVYGAVDCLVLASDREGWANVLLEAMACGTPVAATDIWGTREVVAAPEAGQLIPTREPQAIAHTVTALLAAPPDRHKTRLFAERYSWDETSDGLNDLMQAALSSAKKT
ncbi:MAG: glycosyltransferase family 4 protein [Pseudomonadota bacterium]